MLTSEMCASIEPNHLGDVHCVCACGQKRQVMPQPSLSHPMGLQPPCASSWSLMWPEIVSRDRQLRSVRVLRFWPASMATLVGSVAEELTNSNFMEWSTRVVGPHGVDFVHVSRTFNKWFNVELWPLPAHGSRAGMRAACLVDLKWNGGRARTQ